jgi:hypothetical protein
MIRLLEIPNLRYPKASKAPTGMATLPRSGTCHACRSAFKSKREVVAAAYLRAAHAYILISMPTGTSTIFGVFQAIEVSPFATGRTTPFPIN